MRLLIDEAVNGFVARAFGDAHDAIAATALGLGGAPDDAVAAQARRMDRLVVTEDRGFLSGVAGPHPGLIVLQFDGMTRAERIERALAVLADPGVTFAGHLTVIGRAAIRQRPL